MKVGYARVSSKDQNLDRQLKILKEHGVEEKNIFKEKYSGATKERPEFDKMLNFLRKNDILYITSLDRLSRSHVDLINTIKFFEENNIFLKSIEENIDFSTNVGQLMLQVFAAIHEFHRKTMKENQKMGYIAAKSRGKRFGQPRKLSLYQARIIYETIKKENVPIYKIAKEFKVSRPTIYKAIKEFKEIENIRD